MSTAVHEPIVKLSRDLRTAAATLSDKEARYMVDLYYQIQEYRKATANQDRSMKSAEPVAEPTELITWALDNFRIFENNIKAAIDKYSDAHIVGQWSKSIVGIGPVIAAGLLAHLGDYPRTSASQIWRFAGLDPTVSWEKGQKRPWNASLKTLCWKIGESFVKVSNNDGDVYGKLYQQRKTFETEMNDRGGYSEQAVAKLEKFKIGKGTEAYGHYSSGKLPPAHIHARAKRYAVKMFLSHWFAVDFEVRNEKPAPDPWVIAHGGHVDKVPVPNWPMTDR